MKKITKPQFEVLEKDSKGNIVKVRQLRGKRLFKIANSQNKKGDEKMYIVGRPVLSPSSKSYMDIQILSFDKDLVYMTFAVVGVGKPLIFKCELNDFTKMEIPLASRHLKLIGNGENLLASKNLVRVSN